MTCGCRKWDLTGIPCKHALSAIINQGWPVEDYIHKCYFVETYNKVYEPAIMPINGRKEWNESNFAPPLPPNYGRCRPTKARRREADEVQQKQKKKSMTHSKNHLSLKRQQHTLRCSNCGVEGHNKRGCILKKSSHNEACSQNRTKQVPTQKVHKLQVRRKNSIDNFVLMTGTQEFGQSTTGVQVSSSSTTLPPTMYEQLQQSKRGNNHMF